MDLGLFIQIGSIALGLVSLILVALILLHKNRGGGLTDLFGGGMSSSFGGSSAAERALDRFTLITALMWFVLIIVLLALYKFTYAG